MGWEFELNFNVSVRKKNSFKFIFYLPTRTIMTRNRTLGRKERFVVENRYHLMDA
jgi:hypothetical protein